MPIPTSRLVVDESRLLQAVSRLVVARSRLVRSLKYPASSAAKEQLRQLNKKIDALEAVRESMLIKRCCDPPTIQNLTESRWMTHTYRWTAWNLTQVGWKTHGPFESPTEAAVNRPDGTLLVLMAMQQVGSTKLPTLSVHYRSPDVNAISEAFGRFGSQPAESGSVPLAWPVA